MSQLQHHHHHHPSTCTAIDRLLLLERTIATAIMDNDDHPTAATNLFLPEETIYQILTHFDVPTLIEKKQVCQNWKDLCTDAIDAKQTTESKRTFQTNRELRDAVRKYIDSKSNPNNAEEIACTYGYPIGKWDVSHITDFSQVFTNISNFNEDISSWDVSNATIMTSMFYYATNFNGDLSLWDTSNVTRMDGMFSFTSSFNCDLSLWDTSKVTNMDDMFHCARKFNSDISLWDTSNVTNMDNMFFYARNFNGNISLWNTSKVTTMCCMFCGATSFNHDISKWDISNVTNMKRMFKGATSFCQNILSSWDTTTRVVVSCDDMFLNATMYNQQIAPPPPSMCKTLWRKIVGRMTHHRHNHSRRS